MHKFTQYRGKILNSLLIEEVPYVCMPDVLNDIVAGAWSDYQQVLNSDEDLKEDLSIKYLPDDYPELESSGYHIPVYNLGRWLYSIKINSSSPVISTRFRLYRRDCEKSLRVTWGMPVGNLHYHDVSLPYEEPTGNSVADLAVYFDECGIPRDMISEGAGTMTLYDMIAHISGSTLCGRAGERLAEMLEYIEELPEAETIIAAIESRLEQSVPSKLDDDSLDEYLDRINSFISFIPTYFFGERHARSK